MSHSDHNVSDKLLISAPRTNHLFVILCATALIAFLGNIGVFTWQIIRSDRVDQNICEAANQNREVLRNVIRQSYAGSLQDQLIPVQVRDPKNPKQPTANIILFVPAQKTTAQKQAALEHLTDPVDCNEVTANGSGL